MEQNLINKMQISNSMHYNTIHQQIKRIQPNPRLNKRNSIQPQQNNIFALAKSSKRIKILENVNESTIYDNEEIPTRPRAKSLAKKQKTTVVIDDNLKKSPGILKAQTFIYKSTEISQSDCEAKDERGGKLRKLKNFTPYKSPRKELQTLINTNTLSMMSRENISKLYIARKKIDSKAKREIIKIEKQQALIKKKKAFKIIKIKQIPEDNTENPYIDQQIKRMDSHKTLSKNINKNYSTIQNKSNTSLDSKKRAQSVNRPRDRVFTAALKQFRRKENVIQSESQGTERQNDVKPKEYINKYIIKEIMKTADGFFKNKNFDKLRPNSCIKNRNISTEHSKRKLTAKSCIRSRNDKTTAASEYGYSQTRNKKMKFSQLYEDSTENIKIKPKQLDETSSEHSLIKSPRKYKNLLNQMFKITEELPNEFPEYVLEFPIPELNPSSRLESSYQATSDCEFWFAKGKETTKRGAIDAAMNYYIQGLRVNSKHYQSYHNLGCCSIYMDKCVTAAKYFLKAHTINPSEFVTIYALVIVSIKLGNLDTAK